MSRRRQYPRVGSSYKKHVNKKRDGEPCQMCKTPMPKGSQYWVIDIQTNWFRGDDDVVCICFECRAKVNDHELLVWWHKRPAKG